MSFKANNKLKVPDYFSDDEVEEQDRHDITDDYPYEEDNEEDNEIDEETRRIIFNASSKNIDKLSSELDELYKKEKQDKEDKLNKKLEKKQNKINGKKTLNFAEFNKKMEEEEKAKQPKKFTSKRADEKRKQLGIDEVTGPKRSFNPRKEPFNFVKSNDRRDLTPRLINIDDFPSL
jgi:hypothetical protein